jgi:hypothetical protein
MDKFLSNFFSIFFNFFLTILILAKKWLFFTNYHHFYTGVFQKNKKFAPPDPLTK